MKTDVRSSVVALLSLAILTACSGGGGGGGGDGSSSLAAPIVTLKGNAVKGAISGGQVSVYALDQNGNRLGGPLGSTVTAADGSYSVTVTAPGNNAVVAVLTGGSYVDELTNLPVFLKDGEFLEAYAFLPTGGEKTVHITPLTSIAAAATRQRIRILGNTLSEAIPAGNINVSSAFRIGSALEHAIPALNQLSVQDQEGANYALLLAALTVLDEEDNGQSTNRSALGIVGAMVSDWDEDGVPGNMVGVPSVDDWLRAVQVLRERLGLSVDISGDIAIRFNTAPTARDGDVFLDEDTSVEINVLPNVTDPNGDPIFFVSADEITAKGVKLVSLGDGRIQYTPIKDFHGVDTFKYKVRDKEAHVATGLVKLNVKPVNDAPVSANDSVETFQDIEISGVLKATDIDNAELNYARVSGPAKGTLNINATTGIFTYRSNADALGADEFTFKASDGISDSNIATVNITIQPKPVAPGTPIALTAAFTTNEDTSLSGTLPAQDSDNNITSFAIVTPPVKGTLVLNNPLTGAFTYTPNGGFHGADSFEFRVTDAVGNVSNVARISIAILLVNDPPVVENARIVVSQNDTVQSRFVASDADNDSLVYEIVSGPAKGVATIIDVQNGTFQYTPNSNVTGNDSLRFRVTDTFGASTTGTLEIVIQSSTQPIMVIAAHPDDVPRMTSGVLARAQSLGQPVKVVVLTNGDADSKLSGYKKQLEMMSAAVVANITPDDVIFLGYPDEVRGGLLKIYNQFVNANLTYLTERNKIAETYGKAGLGGQEFHSYLTGAPAAYNRVNLIADLQTIVARYKPAQIYTHSFADDHTDSRVTYLVALEATANVMKTTAGYRPDIRTAIIHSPRRYPYADKYPSTQNRTPQDREFTEDLSWPLPAHANPEVTVPGRYETAVVRFTPDAPFTAPPSLVKTNLLWEDRLILPVPADMQVLLQDPTFVGRGNNTNPKFKMLLAYPSTWFETPSKDKDKGSLFASGKSDEVFFDLPWSDNIAAIANIAASSENLTTMQVAVNVADGIIDGTPNGGPTEIPTEWAASTPNAKLTMTWPRTYVVDMVRLYDRPLATQNITSGVLRFSDGSTVNVGALPADGATPLVVPISPVKTITSMEFEITGSVGNAPGLAEVEVFATADVIANRAPYFTSGPIATNNNYWVAPGETINLFALARDDDGDNLSYSWSAASGSIIGNGTTVQYQAPATVGIVDTITVQVIDGVNSPVSARFAIVVPANVARVATVKASSQSVTPGDRDQLAENAIDGDISGELAPNEDRSAEWKTNGEKAGAFLELTWTKPVTVNRVRLYDRPNLENQVISGVIRFSDGSTENVGPLPDDMSTFGEVSFPAKTITSLRFTVTGVSASSDNIGLAEIEVLRPEAP